MSEKKIPQRKCVGCNELHNRTEMLKVVKRSDGDIALDNTNKINGRSAYICRSAECLGRALKNNGFERSLKCKISEDILVSIEQEINNAG